MNNVNKLSPSNSAALSHGAIEVGTAPAVAGVSKRRKVAVGLVVGLCTILAAKADGVPVITTGNTGFDAEAVLMVASIALIATMAGLGAATNGGVVIWNKVVSYFKRSF